MNFIKSIMLYKRTLFVISTLFLLISLNGKSQVKGEATESIKSEDVENNRGYLRMMFYNCENLYDTFDDSLKNDEAFLPDGSNHWTPDKYYDKLNHICKVITAIGGWEPPDIVGLCEVENRYVIDGLTKHSALSKFNYQVVHKESPDARGIDVALLYIKKKFTPITWCAIPITYPYDPGRKTRDILYVKGETSKKDTLHIFINHWPSRWGGQLESEDNRVFVASVVRSKVDSIFKTDPNASIIITGDLNDYPENKSVKEILKANTSYDNIKSDELYNLSYHLQQKGFGTHKFDGEWGVLDQFILSGALLSKQKNLYTTVDGAHIYNASFLLEKDETGVGFKPYRTYMGFRYSGGYSDHLPPYLDMRRKNTE